MSQETNQMNQHDCCQPAVTDTAGSADSKDRLGRLVAVAKTHSLSKSQRQSIDRRDKRIAEYDQVLI